MSKSVRRVARLLSLLPVLLAFVAGPHGAAGGQAAPEPFRVDSHARGARIEGRLVDGKGTAVASAKVEAYGWADILASQGSFQFGWASPRPVPLGSAVTDAKGRFALANLPTGMIVLVGETPLGGLWGGLAVAVRQRPVALLLRESPVDTRVTGVVLDETGVPLARAPVVTLPSVLPVGEGAILAQFAWSVRTRTDAQGRFELGAIAGPAGIAAQRPRDGRWSVAECRPADDGMASPVRVAFAPGAPLSVRVQGARSGQPVESARVIVVSRAPEGESLTLQAGTADPAGSLRLASFPPLDAGGFVALAVGIGGDWKDAEVSQDARVGVRLGATFSGHVRTADGRPVAGARVIAHAWDWPAVATTTDEGGAYELRGLPRTRPFYASPTHAANGLALAFVDVPGHATDVGTVMLDIGAGTERVTQDFVLHPGATVRGRGDPSDAGGRLTWTPGEWDPYGDLMFVRGTTIGDDGSFVLTDLPPGRVTLGFPGERRVVVDGLKAGETREGVQGPPPK